MGRYEVMKHQTISFIKSGLRLLGYGLILVHLNTAVAFLVFSEVVGVLEEIGHE